jgi:hypothetical protein
MSHAETGRSLIHSQEPLSTTRFEAIDHSDVNGPAVQGYGAKPLRPLSMLLLSAWCGLVAGLLEVTTIVVRKSAFDANHLYGMSRHFVWLVPVTNLCIFATLGLLGCIVCLAWPRRGGWMVTRSRCFQAF